MFAGCSWWIVTKAARRSGFLPIYARTGFPRRAARAPGVQERTTLQTPRRAPPASGPPPPRRGRRAHRPGHTAPPGGRPPGAAAHTAPGVPPAARGPHRARWGRHRRRGTAARGNPAPGRRGRHKPAVRATAGVAAPPGLARPPGPPRPEHTAARPRPPPGCAPRRPPPRPGAHPRGDAHPWARIRGDRAPLSYEFSRNSDPGVLKDTKGHFWKCYYGNIENGHRNTHPVPLLFLEGQIK